VVSPRRFLGLERNLTIALAFAGSRSDERGAICGAVDVDDASAQEDKF
jgi:hypothetical protein